ncbi:alpha-tocopherol transfer protein-like [Centruroides sculpturatus]|uniref:alpha-tocopherol transfer protein-like n=1 Tax=Centruroides sculpturatus TaxID=218467 RepID=UPI000C6E52E0|nr:alpha-tocopherol transfer protein-like [Centruroides sculpturatus]
MTVVMSEISKYKDFQLLFKKLKHQQLFMAFRNENGLKCRMDDKFLLGFLRARKFNLERSLQLLKNYYSIRVKYSSIFKNLFPSKLESILPLNITRILPKPDQHGRIVILTEIERWNPSEVDILDVNRVLILLTDLMLNLHRTQVNGVVMIINTQGANIRHLLQYTPRFISKAIALLILNIHSEITTLHKFVHPEYLPIAYEGELLDFDSLEIIEILKQNDFFRQNEEYVKMYDEEVKRRFTEGTFKYIDQVNVNYEDKVIKEVQEELNRIKEDPENYVIQYEKNALLEVTHL